MKTWWYHLGWMNWRGIYLQIQRWWISTTYYDCATCTYSYIQSGNQSDRPIYGYPSTHLFLRDTVAHTFNMIFTNLKFGEKFNKIITYRDFRFVTEVPISQRMPKVAARIFFLILPYKSGEKHQNSERDGKTWLQLVHLNTLVSYGSLMFRVRQCIKRHIGDL